MEEEFHVGQNGWEMGFLGVLKKRICQFMYSNIIYWLVYTGHWVQAGDKKLRKIKKKKKNPTCIQKKKKWRKGKRMFQVEMCHKGLSKQMHDLSSLSFFLSLSFLFPPLFLCCSPPCLALFHFYINILLERFVFYIFNEIISAPIYLHLSKIVPIYVYCPDIIINSDSFYSQKCLDVDDK